jgi:hypothetical protein
MASPTLTGRGHPLLTAHNLDPSIRGRITGPAGPTAGHHHPASEPDKGEGPRSSTSYEAWTTGPP